MGALVVNIEETLLLDTLRCRLNFLRTKKDYTKKQDVDQLNIPLEKYENYEEGKTLPDILDLIEIIDFYGVTLDYLGGRAENWFYSDISKKGMLSGLMAC